MGVFALVLGRGGSTGFPGKNTYKLLGRPLMAYPLLAAKKSKYIDGIYLSTDSDEIRAVGRAHGAELIERPPELATAAALAEDAFVHGYREIAARAEKQGDSVEILVLLFCNAPIITSELIDEGISVLKTQDDIDSAVTVSRYNMWSPLRARRIGSAGLLDPFVPFETFGDPATMSCDRDSQGDVWFADMGVSVIRPRCLENIESGLLPQKWMGRRIYPLRQEAGLDVDYEWQIPMVEWWLRKQGWSDVEQ